jgi:DnaJ family protein A protein 2
MFEDPFEFFARPPGGGTGGHKRAPRRPQATEVDYELSLEEAYTGKRVVMGVERDRTCGHCHG